MKLAVITNEALREEFLMKKLPGNASVCFVNSPHSLPPDAHIVFDLLFDNSPERIALLSQFLPTPIFINSVTGTLHRIAQPFIRINAWPTFLKRDIIEVAALPAQQASAQTVFEQLGWNYQLVPDIAGMITARIICTIINEAYFTVSAGVSNKASVDTAMKLGTNYPYGPFEWSEKIGLKTIHELLVELSKEKNLYEVSTLLKSEIEN